MPKLSIIIPTNNEMPLGILPVILSNLSQFIGVEVIVVDNSSLDGTAQLAAKHGVRLITVNENSRAKRLNIGINEARAEMLLLHHPRSILSMEAISHLETLENEHIWGGFTHQFDWDHALLKFTSWYSNQVRAKKYGILYLDHCIFSHRSLLGDQPCVPESDIFEDTMLSEKLCKHSAPVVLPHTSLTSAYRFKKNGIYKQASVNQILKLCYRLNVPHKWMNQIYEKGLNLNSYYR